MLRVLHCIYDDPRNPWVAGGGAVRAFEIYRRLVGRVDVTIATGSYRGASDETIEGVRYRRLGGSWPYLWSRASYSMAASGLLALGDYDAAVVDFSTYAPVRVPRDAAVGLTVHHVTGRTARQRWGSLLGGLVERQERRRLGSGHFFSATSATTLQVLRTLVAPGAEIRLIPAGVPDRLFALRRREADYLLYFGRLDWFQKGLDVLLEATALLVRAHPDIRLKVAGRGRDSERVLRAARRLGIRENVEMLGAVEDIERDKLLSGARVLLMPSRFEGFGMVAAEAMAAGVPVVAADAGSLAEVVDSPNGGVLVPPADPAALAGAVDSLLHDPAARRSLGRRARASAGRFRWERIAEEHLAFLEAISGVARQPVPQGERV